MMKFSRASSRVKWLSGEKNDVSKTNSNEDRDGLRNVGFFTAQSFDPAARPTKRHQMEILFSNWCI
jgi:hypothetical protein